MRLSSPIFLLKLRARQISRETDLLLSQALNLVAKQEGYRSWGSLAAKYASTRTVNDVLARFEPGDFILMECRPNPTSRSQKLQFLTGMIDLKAKAWVFSSTNDHAEIKSQIQHFGQSSPADASNLNVLNIDALDADKIVETVGPKVRGGVILIEDLNELIPKLPPQDVNAQIEVLRSYAQRTLSVVIFSASFELPHEKNKQSDQPKAFQGAIGELDREKFTAYCVLSGGKIYFERTIDQP